jgi:hypothetical protein
MNVWLQTWKQTVEPNGMVSKIPARCIWWHPSWVTEDFLSAKVWLFLPLKNGVSWKAGLVCPQNNEWEASPLNATLQFTPYVLQQRRKFVRTHRLHLLRVIRMDLYGSMAHTHVSKISARCSQQGVSGGIKVGFLRISDYQNVAISATKNCVSWKACFVCPQNYEWEVSSLNAESQFTRRELQQLGKLGHTHRLHLLRVIRLELYGSMAHTHVTRNPTAAYGWQYRKTMENVILKPLYPDRLSASSRAFFIARFPSFAVGYQHRRTWCDAANVFLHAVIDKHSEILRYFFSLYRKRSACQSVRSNCNNA